MGEESRMNRLRDETGGRMSGDRNARRPTDFDVVESFRRTTMGILWVVLGVIVGMVVYTALIIFLYQKMVTEKSSSDADAENFPTSRDSLNLAERIVLDEL